MTHYQSLKSEKYWQAAVEEEVKELRAIQKADSRKRIYHFSFVAFFTIFVMYAVLTMSSWLPPVVGILEYMDMIPSQNLG